MQLNIDFSGNNSCFKMMLLGFCHFVNNHNLYVLFACGLGSKVIINFDSHLPKSWEYNCASLFSKQTQKKLGNQYKCNVNGKHLDVRLGGHATLMPGEAYV